MSDFKDTIIISMGGSLLVPDHIDTVFISRLKEMVRYFTQNNYQIVLVIGGGKTARNYQEALRELKVRDAEAFDWVGIKAIHLNCEMLLRAFSDLDIHENIIYEPEELNNIEAPIVIKAALKPGNSSDMGAVRMAQVSGTNRIINFSNISHVYSEDPRVNPDADRFDTLSWRAYRNLIPSDWTPGMSAPFDPVASRLAEESGITVVILGASLENLQGYLDGKSFAGTLIS